jgi:hypothetical protein
MNLLRTSHHRFLPLASIAGILFMATPVWGQLSESAKLLSTDGAADDALGFSTSIDAGVVVCGAYHDAENGDDSGTAYVFDADTGTQFAKLVPNDGAAGDEFGFSTSISGGIVAVGARYDDDNGANSGSVYLFSAATGIQLAKLVPFDGAAGDEFGFAVALDGGILAVGAKRDDDNGSDSGSLYLFEASTGTLLMKLLPNDGAANDNFGESVDMDNRVVAVGAHGNSDNGPLSGSAYLFDVASGLQLNKLLPLDGGTNDFFGTTIAIDNGVVAVGAWADSIFFDHSGSAYLFDVATGFQTAKMIPSDGHDRDHFGYAIAMDAGIVAIGAEQDGDNGFNSGSAYLFDATNGMEVAKILASDGGGFDYFGSAIATENGIVVVGAQGDDDNGDASGSAYVIGGPSTVGTGFCFGDASGTTCPCGNIGAIGSGCANSSYAGSKLIATGSASIMSDDLVLRARNSTLSTPGIFFQGTTQVAGGQGSLLGDGLLCTAGPIVRLEVVFADAQGSADSSTSIANGGGAVAGDTRYYQWWYRDPSGSPCGAGFNLSNGLEIVWAP